MLKLSIIVPIYKVEPYLRKCVDSLLDQDLPATDYEIILVDDGSPDGCPAIVDEYAEAHPGIVAVHRPNGGLSAARNSGLAIAKGEYVQFVDSDDWIEPNVLKTLLDKAKGLDVLRINYQNVDESGRPFCPYKENKPFVDYSPLVCDGLEFLTNRLGFGCYAVQFIVRRNLLDNCLFKEGIYFEDTEWTPRMLLKAKKVASCDLMVYNYLLRKGSITQAVERSKQEKVLRDRMSLIDSLLATSKTTTDDTWFKGMIAGTVVAMTGDLSGPFWSERHKYLKELKRKNIFPLSSYHANKTARRKIRFLNASPSLTLLLLRISSLR